MVTAVLEMGQYGNKGNKIIFVCSSEMHFITGQFDKPAVMHARSYCMLFLCTCVSFREGSDFKNFLGNCVFDKEHGERERENEKNILDMLEGLQ